jgi:hypothetical protein
MLEQALRNNPDLRVAAAKLAEAEAELSRMRLQVVQKVVQAYQAVEAAQALSDFHQKELKRLEELAGKGAVSSDIVAEKQKQLAAAKAQAAAAETDLAYLLGKSAAKDVRDAAVQALLYANAIAQAERAFAEADLPRGRERSAVEAGGAMADRIRKALDRPINVQFDDVPLSGVLNELRENTGIPIIEKVEPAVRSIKVKLKMEKVSLAAFLQLLEDLTPGQHFVVRDYGLLLTSEANLPPGALLVSEFRKRPAESRKGEPFAPKLP